MRRLSLLFLLLAAAAPAGFAQPRPPAPPFISPMGEPFRGASPAAGLELWFAGADADSDGGLTAGEMRRDGARFFASLESDGDGEIEPAEMTRYESEIAPEIQLGRGPMGARERRAWERAEREQNDPGRILSGDRRIRGGSRRGDRSGLEGAGRFGLINIPQPVMDADADLNRGVSAAEFAAAADRRFLVLDTDRDGRLTRPELLALLPKLRERGRRRR